MTHVDLFSGIGGFALAAEWCGIETVTFCESDERCRAFLKRAWPGIPVAADVRYFEGWRYRGAWLLTAGVPCQPTSRAGKQRGAADDRWLWPEALRVLGECQPTWALFENPAGIGDVGLAGVLAEMEAHGYQVRVFGIPACAVGAPHRRERYWIVGGLANGNAWRREAFGFEKPPGEQSASGSIPHGRRAFDLADATQRGQREHGGAPGQAGHADECGTDDLADAGAVGRNTRRDSGSDGCEGSRPRGEADGLLWSRFVWVPCADGKFRRAPDDSIGVVDGLHRSVLGALGNAIVPQVAARIIAAMKEAES